MANKTIVYTDRAVAASIHNGLVRLDLATFGGTGKTKDGKEAYRMDITHQVVMPLDAFVESLRIQQGLLQQIANKQNTSTSSTPPTGGPSPEQAG